MIDRKAVSKLVKQIIDSSPYTPTEVAGLAGFSQGTVSKWINDKTNINLIDYIRICEVCGVPNGVFDEKLMDKKIPPAISSQIEDLTDLLVKLSELSKSDDSPVKAFIENAEFWLKVIKESDQ